MFRPMRRSRQALSQEDCLQILARGTSGVLALSGDDGYPYAVPLSYVYTDGKLYFHCAKQGHKLDAIARSSKASFCVIDQDQVVPQEFTSYFRSVIAFGRVRIITDPHQFHDAIRALSQRYSPGDPGTEDMIAKELPGLCMLEMTVEHLTGKQAKELMEQ